MRNPAAAAGQDYDAIIIGGGIHGCMALLYAARAGNRTLLIERDDFGGATSLNSLRIIHGGLRYLQSLDIPRFVESVGERRWLLRAFPDLVKPLPCLMPLYGQGLKRRSVMAVALALNDALSAYRNRGVRADRRLPSGRVLSTEETLAACSFIRRERLSGAALWYDACVPDSHRVVMETLRWAAACGGTMLNYVEARGLLTNGDDVAGVEAYDRLGGRSHRYRAPIVINAAGPWCNDVVQRFAQPTSVAEFSLAWNVLFDRPAGTRHAVALTPPHRGGRTYFLHPWKGRLLVGTGHREWLGDPADVAPPDAALEEFIDDLNAAAPALALSRREVQHVFAGLLPATTAGSADLARRPRIVDHARHGGKRGLFSVAGIKFTTARRAAVQVLRASGLRTDPLADSPGPPMGAAERCAVSVSKDGPLTDEESRCLESLTCSEWVCSAEDLVYRRLGLYGDPARAKGLFDRLQADLSGYRSGEEATEIARDVRAP